TWSLTDPLSLLELKPVFDFIVQKFKAEEYGRVFVAFSGFVNTMVQKPVFRQLLPIEPEPLMNMAKAGGSSLDGAEAHKQFLLEPSPAALLDTILPLYVFHGLVQIVLEARASEHSARMVAMKGATENAKNIIGGLTLDYNKARQTQITNELLEITTAMRAME
ncbi:MAG: F0F1 ATP synthase subunit gamma, partial [Akkermansia muciniphila]